MTKTVILSGWRFRFVIISIILSAIGYLGFSLWGGWHQVYNAILKVGFIGMCIALTMSLINYGLRFLRWQSYLKALGHAIPWRPSLQIYLAGFALTTTPGKAGEALRGILLKYWNVPYPQSFAAFFSERLSDLFAVVLLTLIGLTLYPEASSMIVVGIFLIILSFLAVTQKTLVEYLLQKLSPLNQNGKIRKVIRHVLNILIEAHNCHKINVLIFSTLLSLTAWAAEALAFHWILLWMGADVSLSFTIFIYAISMLAGALSFMPGGLGGTEAVMITLLVWKGVPNSDAIAATVLIRLATLWFAVAIGSWALFKVQSQQKT